jgi:large subunit ribosomal protein L20
MVRIKSSVTAHKRKKRVLKEAKGAFGSRSKHYKEAIKTINRGRVYAYRDRKVNKRAFRSLWIVRIKAACELAGMSYSRFIGGLKNAKVDLNRKVLAELAANSTAAFNKLVEVAQQAPAAPKVAKVAKDAKVIKVTKVAKKA